MRRRRSRARLGYNRRMCLGLPQFQGSGDSRPGWSRHLPEPLRLALGGLAFVVILLGHALFARLRGLRAG